MYQIQFLLDNFVLDDSKEQENIGVDLNGLENIKNETIFVNYFTYKVQTLWDNIENYDENEASAGKTLEELITAESSDTDANQCEGCSVLTGKSSVKDYSDATFSRGSKININIKATPVYYQNFLNYQSYSGYMLQFVSMRKDAYSTNHTHDIQESTLNSREVAIFKNQNGSFSKFQPQYFEHLRHDEKQSSIEYIKNEFLKEFEFGNENHQEDTDLSKFEILFKLNLSENITQVRVTKRKSWISTVAEMLAYIGGLSF